jgi:integrase
MRAKEKLTKLQVEKAKWQAPPADKVKADAKRPGTRPMFLADGGGLLLRLTKDDTKSWIFRYQRHDVRHDVGLGAYPAITLPLAREAAAKLRTAIATGHDPIVEKREARRDQRLAEGRNVTFQRCSEEYLTMHRAGWRKGSTSEQQWRNSFKDHAGEILPLPVGDITVTDVLRVLQPIWEKTNETAVRLRTRIEAVLSYAKTANYRSGANAATWDDNLEHLLPSKRKLTKAGVVKKRPMAALPYVDVGAFLAKLRALPQNTATQALQFIILTVARVGEVLAMEWPEVDLQARTWTVPAEKIKGGVEHVVPLSDAAMAILEALPQRSGTVFRSDVTGRRLDHSRFRAIMLKLGHGDMTRHGFRSSFADWMTERTSYSVAVRELSLAHKAAHGNEVASSYTRTKLIDQRRQALQQWADFIQNNEIAGADIVPIRA